MSNDAFRVTSATTRATGGFLELVEAQLHGPDDQIHTRFLVRHPGAVVAVPVDADGHHVFLIRQYRVAADRTLLEIPAGKRDVEGEPPHETARREIEEEIGVRPGRLVPLCEFYNSPGFCDEYTYLYCALDLEPLAARHPVTAEEATMTVERVPIDAIEDLITRREIVDAKTIVGLLLTRRYLSGEFAGLRD